MVMSIEATPSTLLAAARRWASGAVPVIMPSSVITCSTTTPIT